MTADRNETTLYEELSMNAHPALKTQLYDGWVLRFSNGYTNRANSVNPLYPAQLPLGEKIEQCEKLYGSQHLPVVFKLTHACPEDLDTLLERRGYALLTPTNIMTARIGDTYRTSPHFYVNDFIDEGWTEKYFALNGLTESDKQTTARQMLRNIQNKALCGLIKKDGHVVACGLCVVERGYAGLFDIVTDSDYRQRGFGTDMCASLLGEAKKYGAEQAYLQVVQSNTPAVRLYDKLGFSNLYEYWYRKKDISI